MRGIDYSPFLPDRADWIARNARELATWAEGWAEAITSKDHDRADDILSAMRGQVEGLGDVVTALPFVGKYHDDDEAVSK